MIQGKLCSRVTVDAGAMRYEFSNGTEVELVDKSVALGTYQDEARWHHQRPTLSYYYATIRKRFTMVECIGRVWQKNDGRWNWIRHASKFQGGWETGQGVTMTKTDALLQVEKGWL